MIDEYRKATKSLYDDILSTIVWMRGSVSFQDALFMTRMQYESLQETVKDRLKQYKEAKGNYPL